jgi:hypothetical protein
MGLRMVLRGAVLLAAAAIIGGSAQAGEILGPEQAKAFVADKLFSYTCFDGTTGAGRIHADGSVVGSIRVKGQGSSRFVALPTNTIRVNPSAICASVRGLPFSPCFKVEKIDNHTFRGSISGLGFAYCDFKRRGHRMLTAEADAPVPLRAKIMSRPRVNPIRAAAASEGSEEPELKLRPSKSE